MTDAAPQLPMELDAGGEVVLHASPELAREMAPLVEALLAEGFHAHVVVDSTAFEAALVDADAAAVHVVCRRGDELDFEAMCARARELTGVEHIWLDGLLGGDTPVRLFGSIARALGEIEWRSAETVIERVDVDEVSNVVLMPIAPPVVKAPARRRHAWRDRVIAGLICAGILAMPFVLIEDHPPEASEPAPVAIEPASEASMPSRAFVHDLHQPAPPIAVVVVEEIPEPEPVVVPSAPVDDAITRAVASGKARAAGGLVVSPRVDGSDWFRAMSACRGRRFFGASGWSPPTRTQLIALARARVLPDTLLWTRNKADSEGEQAYAIGGRSGLGRALPKSSTDVALVCVKVWPE